MMTSIMPGWRRLMLLAFVAALNVSGTVIKGSGHWLMEEASGQVVPLIVASLKE
jgi:hypothetical protein